MTVDDCSVGLPGSGPIVHVFNEVLEPRGTGNQDVRCEEGDHRHHEKCKVQDDQSDGDKPDLALGNDRLGTL